MVAVNIDCSQCVTIKDYKSFFINKLSELFNKKFIRGLVKNKSSKRIILLFKTNEICSNLKCKVVINTITQLANIYKNTQSAIRLQNNSNYYKQKAIKAIYNNMRNNLICPVCETKKKRLLSCYGVKACDSCKRFFVRLKDQQLIPCIYGGNCPITSLTHTNCKACLFKKCLTLGMNYNYHETWLFPNQIQPNRNFYLNYKCKSSIFIYYINMIIKAIVVNEPILNTDHIDMPSNMNVDICRINTNFNKSNGKILDQVYNRVLAIFELKENVIKQKFLK